MKYNFDNFVFKMFPNISNMQAVSKFQVMQYLKFYFALN